MKLFSSLPVFIFYIFINESIGRLPDLRRCADEQCKKIISEGRTTQRYTSLEKGILSFRTDEPVLIYSKHAGNNLEYWGVKIKGRPGYMPKKFVREEKEYIKYDQLKYDVPTHIPVLLNDKHKEHRPPENEDANQKIIDEPPVGQIVLNSNDVEYNTIKKLDEKPISNSNTDKESEKSTDLNPENFPPEIDKGDSHSDIITNANVIKDPSVIDEDENLNVSPPSLIPVKESVINVVDSADPPNIDKEADNEDEGNGNEGEENGTEVQLENTADDSNINNTNDAPTISDDTGTLVDISPVTESTVDRESPIQTSGTKLEEQLNPSIEPEKEFEPEEEFEPSVEPEEEFQPSVEPEEEFQPSVEPEEEFEPSVEPEEEFEPSVEPEEEFQPSVEHQEELKPSVEHQEELKPSIEHQEELKPSIEPQEELKPSIEPQDELKQSIEPQGELKPSNIEFKEQLESSITETKEQMPTPVSNVIIAGTTFPVYLDDQEPYESVTNIDQDSFYTGTSPIPLQTSQYVEQISVTTVATPIVPQHKIVESKITNSVTVAPIKDYGIPPLLGKASPHRESSIVSQIPVPITQNDKSSEHNSEFESLKPESILKNKLNLVDTTINEQAPDQQIPVLESIEEIDTDNNEPTVDNTDDDSLLSLKFSEERTDKSKETGYLSSLFSFGASSDDKESESKHLTNENIQIVDQATVNVENVMKVELETNLDNDKLIESELNKSKLKHQNNAKSELEHINDQTPESEQIEDINLNSKQQNNTDKEYEYPDSIHNLKLKQEDNSKPITEPQIDLTQSSQDPSIDITPVSEQFIYSVNTEELPSQSPEIIRKIDSEIANLSFTDPSNNDKPIYKESSTENSDSLEVNQGETRDTSDEVSLTDQILNMSLPLIGEGLAFAVEGELAEHKMSAGSVTFLMIMSGTIVIIYITHLILMKFSRESPILDAMNKLDRQHRFIVEENNNLKNKLSTANGQVIKEFNPSNVIELKNLKEESESMKLIFDREKSILIDKIEQLECDFESSVANAEELHTMNSDLLSSQKETSNFEESVDHLQFMLNAQKEIVGDLTSDLTHKTRLIDELRNESKSTKTKSIKLDNQVEQLMKSLEEVNGNKKECLKRLEMEETTVTSLREMTASHRKDADDIRKELDHERIISTRVNGQIKEIKEKLHFKQAECQVAKECLKKLQLYTNETGNNTKGTLEELLQILEVKSSLVAVENERVDLKQQLCHLETDNDAYRDQTQLLSTEILQIQDSLLQITTDRDQLKSKLGVLSQYYEEKEAKLKKELESQEGLRLNAEGSAVTINYRIQSYEHEIISQKEKFESLQLEFEEQKKSFKMQLTNEEKRAHENWITSRSAERRQEELRQENTQLRQRLSALHNQDKSLPIRGEANGSLHSPVPIDTDADGILDPMMMRPPLPMHSLFGPPNMPHPPPGMPPPPPWGLPPMIPPPGPHPDRRMPPAGRIASPPGFDRRSYSPGSEHSHYSDHHRGYSPGPSRFSPDRSRRNPRRRDQPSPSSLDRHSPDQWITRSPPGGYINRHRSPAGGYRQRSPTGGYSNRHRSPARGYYDEADNDESGRILPHHIGKKTSTPLGPNDR